MHIIIICIKFSYIHSFISKIKAVEQHIWEQGRFFSSSSSSEQNCKSLSKHKPKYLHIRTLSPIFLTKPFLHLAILMIFHDELRPNVNRSQYCTNFIPHTSLSRLLLSALNPWDVVNWMSGFNCAIASSWPQDVPGIDRKDPDPSDGSSINNVSPVSLRYRWTLVWVTFHGFSRLIRRFGAVRVRWRSFIHLFKK